MLHDDKASCMTCKMNMTREWELQSATSLCFYVYLFISLPHPFAKKMTYSPQSALIHLWALLQKLQANLSHKD